MPSSTLLAARVRAPAMVLAVALAAAPSHAGEEIRAGPTRTAKERLGSKASVRSEHDRNRLSSRLCHVGRRLATHRSEHRDRSATGRPDLQLEKAAELVRLKVDLFVTFFTPTALAAKQATRDIPIVMAGAADPVAVGLVTSLARPGGNVTGQSSGGAEVAGKSVELIRELIPAARRVGVLADESDPFAKPYVAQIGQAARSAGMEVEPIMTRPGQPLEAAFETLTGKRVDGLLIQGSIARKEMLDLAIKHRLPALTSIRLGPPLGALMSYGSDYFALARQSAVYVGKILRGAKPADLPVAFPTKFLLIINLKTAKALGLTIPPTLLARADEVIE